MGLAAGLAAVALIAHAATAWRYGYFRDELYFIACAKHLAWGYVDQPPLVALAAWLAAPAGYALLALRALPILAAAATVFVTVRLTRELGGGSFAQTLAGLAALLAPAYLLLGNTLTTTSFEPLSWTLTVYICVRLLRQAQDDNRQAQDDNRQAQDDDGGSHDDRRRGHDDRTVWWWLGLAVVVAFGAYGKYSIGLLVVALAIGLLMTPQRRLLRTPCLPYAIVLAVALVSPNLGWQAAHGWPFLEVLRGDAAHRPSFQIGIALEYRSIASNAIAFALEQLVYTNPLAVPIWLAGIIAPFVCLRALRFVAIAYAVLFVAAVLLEAKGYYIIGIYASLFAIGSVAIERAAAPALRSLAFAAMFLVGIAALPLSLPVLPIDSLIAYTKLLGLTGRHGTPAHLIQPLYAEEFGWNRLARDVAAVYRSLPAQERSGTAVYADTYGDAGALDFFGPRYGLPAAISSQNTYYLWGIRGYDGRTLIAIGASRIDLLRRYYRSVTLIRTSTEPYKWIVEGPAPIYVCRDPVAPLSQIWPHLRWYGA